MLTRKIHQKNNLLQSIRSGNSKKSYMFKQGPPTQILVTYLLYFHIKWFQRNHEKPH